MMMLMLMMSSSRGAFAWRYAFDADYVKEAIADSVMANDVLWASVRSKMEIGP